MTFKYKSSLASFPPIPVLHHNQDVPAFLKWNNNFYESNDFNSIGFKKFWNFIPQSKNSTRIFWVPRKDG